MARRPLRWFVALAIAAGHSMAAWGQSAYPAKALRMIVPFAPGGVADFAARGISGRLSEALGVPVVIDNRAGAGGVAGAELAAKAPADGATVMITSIAITISASVNRRLGYDVQRDFTPVAQIIDAPNFLVVHPSLPVRSVKELIALARARRGEITFASSGPGTSPHLSGELFKVLTGVDLLHVPYKGGGPAVIDLVGGHVLSMFATMPSAIGQVKAGKLRGVAVTGARRFPAVPEYPTVAEAGVAGYEVSGWCGMFAPAGMPRELVQRLASETGKILAAAETRERFIPQGAEPATRGQAEFAAFVDAEIGKWRKVVAFAGLKAD